MFRRLFNSKLVKNSFANSVGFHSNKYLKFPCIVDSNEMPPPYHNFYTRKREAEMRNLILEKQIKDDKSYIERKLCKVCSLYLELDSGEINDELVREIKNELSNKLDINNVNEIVNHDTLRNIIFYYEIIFHLSNVSNWTEYKKTLNEKDIKNILLIMKKHKEHRKDDINSEIELLTKIYSELSVTISTLKLAGLTLPENNSIDKEMNNIKIKINKLKELLKPENIKTALDRNSSYKILNDKEN